MQSVPEIHEVGMRARREELELVPVEYPTTRRVDPRRRTVPWTFGPLCRGGPPVLV